MNFNPKTKILDVYLRYKTLRDTYNKQNFWLIISSITTLISITLLNLEFNSASYYPFYAFTVLSCILVIKNIITNKGIILCTTYRRKTYEFYKEVDEIINDLCENYKD